jgi:predicted RNA-binding Zn-ribbon protein involved in translation (DUF1610 family)
MARRKGDTNEFEAEDPESRRVLVYLPCPVCRRAVQLSDKTRVEDDPETYECPNCGARFYLAAPTP